jgi:hypothetical protein
MATRGIGAEAATIPLCDPKPDIIPELMENEGLFRHDAHLCGGLSVASGRGRVLTI